MDVAYVSALSALAGSVVGGLTSGLTTWINQRGQAKAEQLAHNLTRREELFKDFIVEASKVYGQALMSNQPQIEELVALYAMISRMRVLCSPQVFACGEKVMRVITDTYAAPNKTISELGELIHDGTSIDPLKDFADAARDELQTFSP